MTEPTKEARELFPVIMFKQTNWSPRNPTAISRDFRPQIVKAEDADPVAVAASEPDPKYGSSVTDSVIQSGTDSSENGDSGNPLTPANPPISLSEDPANPVSVEKGDPLIQPILPPLTPGANGQPAVITG